MIEQLDGDEFIVLLLSVALSIWALFRLRIAPLHQLFIKDNIGIGLIRLSVLLSLCWFLYVIKYYADQSVVGIYIYFYLIMGYALTRNLGQFALEVCGISLRVDVYERKNRAAAVLFAAFTISTGIIFGASLWGDADAFGDDEGGWWIPLIFFMLGWGSLLLVFLLYLLRERPPLVRNVRQDRNPVAAQAAAAYLISSSIVIADAVAGDFFGWWESLRSFAYISGLLIVHEIFSTLVHKHDDYVDYEPPSEAVAGRWWEILSYFALVLFSWIINRVIEKFL